MVLLESYCSLVEQTFASSNCSVQVLHHCRQRADLQDHSSQVSLLNRTTFFAMLAAENWLHQKLGLAHGYLMANLAKRLSALLKHQTTFMVATVSSVPAAFSFDSSVGNSEMLEDFAVQGDLAELGV